MVYENNPEPRNAELLESLHGAPDISTPTAPGSPPFTASMTDLPSDTDGQYLDVPTRPSYRRRPSLDSTYSALSELSIYSDELRQSHPLVADGAPRLASISRSPLRPQSGWRRTLSDLWIRNKGVAYVLLAQAFGSGMNVATRILETDGVHGKGLHPFQILFARQSITVVVSLAYGYYAHVPYFPFGPRNLLGLLIARATLGFFGVFGLYFALLYLPLAEAVVLTFLAPILTCYSCSVLIPGETFSYQQQLAAYLGLVGVVFIALSSPHSRDASAGPTPGGAEAFPNSTTTAPSFSAPAPPTAHQHFLAILLSMLGVVGGAGAMTAIRWIGTRAHPLISVNYFSVWCSLVSLIAVLAVPSVGFRLPGNLLEWALLASLGGCGFVMQFLLTAGLAYGGRSNDNLATAETANIEGRGSRARLIGKRERDDENMKSGSGTRATNMVYTQMLFALTFDKLIWGITPTWASWIGSGLILGSAVWVAIARDKDGKQGQGGPGIHAYKDASGPSVLLAGLGKDRPNDGTKEEEQGLMNDIAGQPHNRSVVSEEGEGSNSRETLET